MSYFEPQDAIGLSKVDNQIFNRELCYAMREAMKHTVKVINDRKIISKKESIGIWCTSLRSFFRKSEIKDVTYSVGLKWLTDPRSWEDVGKLRIVHRNDKGSRFIMAEANYWAQDARERFYEEPKYQIESDLRDCKRIISSFESLIKDAENLNKKADNVIGGLVKVAEELSA